MRITVIFPVVVAAVLFAGCATAVDVESVTARLNRQGVRIATLEKGAGQKPGISVEVEKKLHRVEADLKALRKSFADSKAITDILTEKVGALEAFMKEVDRSMFQSRKKGLEIDRSMEEMANKVGAEVRSLSEKLKKLVEKGR